MEEQRKERFHCYLRSIIFYINSLFTSLPPSLKHMVRAIIKYEKTG